MKKYLTIINLAFQRGLTYRFTVLSYRIGEVIEGLVVIVMWSSIYKSQPIISGYTLSEMVTYILVGSLVNAVVRNWLMDVVSKDIKDGGLSAYLIKPMQYFSYVLTRELGRIMLPLILSFASQIIVTLFFLKLFIFNNDVVYLFVIVLMVLLAFVTELLVSYLIGLVAFWTLEVDGLYTTIWRIKKLFSGGYFPLSLLPIFYVKISYVLPFAYSFFIPTQLYLKKMDISEGIKGLGIQIIWIMLLYLIIKIVWKRGLRKYEGVGI